MVLDVSRLDQILSLDAEERIARVEPGVVQADLDAAAREHGLCFGPDTATASRATIGGMVGNDSAGMRSVVYGRTSHRVRRLRVLLADGTEQWVGEAGAATLDGPFAAARAVRDACAAEIEERWPKLLRCVDGYNLPALAGDRPHLARFLCGSEGTLALALAIEVELDPLPEERAWTIVRLQTLDAIGDASLAVLPSAPTAVEIVDAGAIVGSAAARDISAGADAVLLVEHSGTREEVRAARSELARGRRAGLRRDRPRRGSRGERADRRLPARHAGHASTAPSAAAGARPPSSRTARCRWSSWAPTSPGSARHSATRAPCP